jgi:hypothetical protein
MSDDNAGAGRSGEAGIDPLFRLGVAHAFARARADAIRAAARKCTDELAQVEAIFARIKEDWVNKRDDPTEFKAVEKETGGPGSGVDTRLTITREDHHDGLRLLIEELGGDYAQITLSADQVAALRLWLVP